MKQTRNQIIKEQIEYMEKLRQSSGICYDELDYKEDKEYKER